MRVCLCGVVASGSCSAGCTSECRLIVVDQSRAGDVRVGSVEGGNTVDPVHVCQTAIDDDRAAIVRGEAVGHIFGHTPGDNHARLKIGVVTVFTAGGDTV